ncbi:UDP-N-acetylmuramoyl-tripeptide--D-alanyl-D-alanine ligase [Candidatus Saccharibacteria bacterium]|nr:UDP-N-acetylmuramoyl-tripeptide--D-alanyl-D-alanine ligase [Candidatus Saccharibacteria bacterium]
MQYDGDMFKRYVQKRLERYVVKYFAKHPEVTLIAVVGSVGKTSTKRAIADVLSYRFRVRMHEGNHNTEMAAPLAILGIEYPSNIRSPLAWLAVFRAAKLRIKQPTDVDVIIQELGTDHPGEIAAFGKYLTPYISLVTAIAPEHMEFFGTIEEVAKEEMAVGAYSKFVLINRDDVDAQFAELEQNPNFSTYGTSGVAEYRFEQQEFSVESGYIGSLIAVDHSPFGVTIKVVGEHSLRPVIGAVAVAMRLGMTEQDILQGLALVRPVPGRMNILRGITGTTIIDDTYNSSPAAAEAALRTLYLFDAAPQRIAILGDMRELGESSQREHEKLGEMCDPGLLSWIVAVGPDCEKYLAPVARRKGCQVHVARNAIEAGEFVRSVTQEGAVILAKGSQNTIFLEEAVKILCDITEHSKLVRQSVDWQQKKNDYFAQFQK